MGEKERSQTEYNARFRRHPIIQQLTAVFLGICLIVVSIPASPFGFQVQAARLQQAEMESEHIVTGDDGGEDEGTLEEEMLVSEMMTEADDTEADTETDENPTEPACGRITQDVTWEADGILANGELIVEPGATLTIKGSIIINGSVAIYGGGTIARETGGFVLRDNGSLTLSDITLDGKMSACSTSIIRLYNNTTLIMEEGCTIKNGYAYYGGAVYSMGGNNTVVMNHAVIENCSTTRHTYSSPRGGAMYFEQTGSLNSLTLNGATIRNCTAQDVAGGIYAKNTNVTINGGNYENNQVLESDNAFAGGGFMFICGATLTINDGNFIGNIAATKGGCIEHCGHENTRTYINGGRFIGNTCTNQKYKGSGAIYNSTVEIQNTSVTLSGDVMFGDGGEGDGTDGIYLDSRQGVARKVWISDTLTYPVTLYLDPQENYVIAEGSNQYQLLKRRDMKKIFFVDLTNSDRKWYARLDEETNQVHLTTTSPDYGYFVYYIKNGYKGTAPIDDTEYEAGDEVTVKSAEGLDLDGYVFNGWNTEPDGSGTTYLAEGENNTFIIEDDTNLYAVFQRQLTADFYSGSAGNKETLPAVMNVGGAGGVVTAPDLEPMDDFEPIGWDADTDGYDGELEEGAELTVTEDTAYYGVYGKDVTLSYDANGGEDCPGSETKTCRANVHEEITYDVPEFEVAEGLERTGYVFAGWNTEEDGTGEPYDAGGICETDEDITLYAIWVEGDDTAYRIEHYKQDPEGDGYTREDADTEYKAGTTGDLAVAEANPYEGFTLNTDPELGTASGIVEADGSLVLQLYYDRELYEVDFDLNGGEGEAPEGQSVRYGAYLERPEKPVRRGYTFKGWYKDEAGTEEAYWDFYQVVEENTDTESTTLYAKWEDDIAPVLGEASFGTDYKDLMGWVISKKKLIITVPVTEEGSGLMQADYLLEPENGKVKEGTAKIRSEKEVTPMLRARSGGIGAVMTFEGDAESGQSVVEIAIKEDFKGSISMTCTDYAGNVSVRKVLTADGAGAVVEDHAPDITFSGVLKDEKKGMVKATVDVSDTAGKNITAGLASVTYKVDEEKEQAEGEEEFADSMTADYSFDVTIKGEGEHILLVTAEDNAGNVSTKQTRIKITKKKAVIVKDDPKPNTPVKKDPGSTTMPKSTPTGGAPRTGDPTFVKIFATMAMVAGFTYLLLYFTSGENGITEKEKEEIIYRLVRWARKGRFRKYPALLLISLFLIYYHSIGKSVDDDWKQVYEG